MNLSTHNCFKKNKTKFMKTSFKKPTISGTSSQLVRKAKRKLSISFTKKKLKSQIQVKKKIKNQSKKNEK
jgi:hypothetical protein